ncbi:MAG: T9SS type A sorting domain-containing protein [Bacteroidaceae bacterium]|nr:T9SS type A sorting domain-containing protein [Bacteroidaceae bacterium]
MKKFTLLLMAAAMICGNAMAQNRVKNIYTFASRLNLAELEVPAQTVQMHRTLLAGYNTLCLPMSLDAEQLQAAAADVQVERLAAVRQEGSTLCLYFLDCTAEGIEAGVPYLIFTPKTQNLRASTANARLVSTDIMPVTMTDGQGNRVTFTSSWQSLQGDGRFGIPAKQDVDVLQSILIRTEPDKTFLPTRCGVIWEQQAPTATRLEIRHITSLDGIATSLETLKAKNALVDIYDVKGQLVRRAAPATAVESLPSGIYVIGGRKVAVK